MQLQPIDEASQCGAFAALGKQVVTASGAWVARDAVTASPRAYVALIDSAGEPEVVAAAGLFGDAQDAQQAADVVTRFAAAQLGLDAATQRIAH